jgi:hypothetical protein
LIRRLRCSGGFRLLLLFPQRHLDDCQSLIQMGHEVIVAHARNVRLIGESRRKDDQLDARTLHG